MLLLQGLPNHSQSPSAFCTLRQIQRKNGAAGGGGRGSRKINKSSILMAHFQTVPFMPRGLTSAERQPLKPLALRVPSVRVPPSTQPDNQRAAAITRAIGEPDDWWIITSIALVRGRSKLDRREGDYCMLFIEREIGRCLHRLFSGRLYVGVDVPQRCHLMEERWTSFMGIDCPRWRMIENRPLIVEKFPPIVKTLS